jgi:hypothetical protein
MKKTETEKLLNKIKGYYNSQFFIDEYVLDAWNETLKPYELEDALEHIQKYIKECPDIAPKPHTFIKGLLTPEEKSKYRNSDFTVACQLCGRWMPIEEYDSHYGKCLDIEYLINVAKEKGQNITRADLEEYPQTTIDKLLKKYEPKGFEL